MKKKALLIAEKFSLMRELEKVYRKINFKDDITFVHAQGHLLSLKYPGEYNKDWEKWSIDSLPILPKNFTYKVINRDLYNKIKKEIDSGKYDYIINAGDAEREGQLIVRSILHHANNKLPVKRIWIQDMSEKGLEKAFNSLEDDNNDRFKALTSASVLRSHLDWLLGMNLSRAITLKSNTTIPVGRVMTPTLNIIVQREKEIRNFVPKDFFELIGSFEEGYKGKWFHIKNNGTRFSKIETANKLKDKIMQGKNEVVGIVKELNKKTKRKYPFQLHTLADLQIEANKVYGYSSGKTLEIAQSLYQDKKLLTYPRTDSKHLPKNVALEIPNQLKKIRNSLFTKEIDFILSDNKRIDRTLKSKRYVDDKKVSDHFAIIPTDNEPDLKLLSEEEENIYYLVVRRLVAMFLDPEVTEETEIISEVSGELFRTKGNVLKDKGYTVLYNFKRKDNELPALKQGQKVTLKNIDIEKGKTTPPKRFKEADLISIMDNINRLIDDEELKDKDLSLGTSATAAGIREKLIENKMVTKKKDTYYPTQFGEDIIDLLDGRGITSPKLTAIWEKKLKEVEQLNLSSKEFEKEMIAYVTDVTKDIVENVNKDLSKYNNKGKSKGKSKGNFKAKKMGKCILCGGDILALKNVYMCENKNNKEINCEFMIAKKIKGVNITQTDIKNILKGKNSSTKKFPWGNSQIYYDKENGLKFKNVK